MHTLPMNQNLKLPAKKEKMDVPVGEGSHWTPQSGDQSSFNLPLIAPMQNPPSDLSRFFDVLRRKWVILFLVMVLFQLCAAVYLLNAPRRFRSTALIELSARRPRLFNTQAAVIEDPAVGVQFEQAINTQLEKLRGAAMLKTVIAQYRRMWPQDRTPDIELEKRLKKGVAYNLLRRTRLVQVAFINHDPQFAARACMAFAQGAETHARAENQAVSESAVAWLEAQARVQRQELEKAEQDLFNARQQAQLDALETQRKTVQESLMDFNRELVELESQVSREAEMLRAIRAIDLKPENAGRLPDSIPRVAEINTALQRWVTAVTERDEMLVRYTSAHPEIQNRNKNIDLLRDQTVSALERSRSTAAANLETLRKQADSIRAQKEAQSKLAAELERDIVGHEMRQAELRRTRDTADLTYKGLLNRIQEARLSADENTATVKLVLEAEVPDRPVSPVTHRVVVWALLLGCFAGVVLAFWVDHREDYIRQTIDIELPDQINILGVIPHLKAASRCEVALAVINSEQPEIAEVFASVRHVLDSTHYRSRSQILLVTSSFSGEGKTTTCCNLALAIARNGQRVLLIDLDLRRPRIENIFNSPPNVQYLSEFLKNKFDDPRRMIYSTDYPNLDIIASCAARTEIPAEILVSSRIQALIDWARPQYDRIILDTPPLGLVSDALAMADKADLVVIMARPSVTRNSALRHTVARLWQVGAPQIVLMMADATEQFMKPYGYESYGHYRRQYRDYLTDT